ncbi:YjbF family lipoprotein [Idiomarina sp. 29L]|uniref:YjbF family lipoprotein n=1 Tax=Idiomarina sp. 29L TaxID=2508877 RepID=UPI001013C27B|nr:YjbF family lipoprotein [Idiomarina sp. 29L]RXS43013.1 YjbF family lipoprotein [Idiomarina sp. 29L]
MIRNGFFAGFLLILVGCTAVTDEVRETVEFAFKDIEDAELSAEEIDNFPYTSLYAQWQGKARSLIVLGFVNKPNKYHFITAEKETFVLENGRVTRTQSLDDNLLSVSNLKNDPLRCIVTAPQSCNSTWQRAYDYQFDGGTRVSRDVKSTFTVKQQEQLAMPYGQATATLVEEVGEFVLTGERFVNRFWVEPDGHVIKSEQRIIPNKPLLNLTQVTWIGRTNNSESAQ